MVKVCAGMETVKGIDVSRWQTSIDWKAQAQAGVRFMFAKATEGLTQVDSMFEKHVAGAKAQGILVGAYHFFHPSESPEAQAQHFLNVAGGVTKRLVMDWETSDHMPSMADQDAGSRFLSAILYRSLVNPPVIYGSPYFLEALKLNEVFSDHPLWIAHYGTKCPLVPSPWRDWVFWQTSDQGIDYNLYNGSYDSLKAFWG